MAPLPQKPFQQEGEEVGELPVSGTFGNLGDLVFLVLFRQER